MSRNSLNEIRDTLPLFFSFSLDDKEEKLSRLVSASINKQQGPQAHEYMGKEEILMHAPGAEQSRVNPSRPIQSETHTLSLILILLLVALTLQMILLPFSFPISRVSLRNKWR